MSRIEEIKERVKSVPNDWLDDENTDEEYLLSKLELAIGNLEYMYEKTPNADECYRIVKHTLKQIHEE